MLIPIAVLRRVVAGEVDLAFRRWTRPSAKTGGTLRTAVGVLAIDEVTEVTDAADITDDDALRSGVDSADEVRAELAKRSGTIYRVRFHLAGDDPRIALRNNAELNAAELDDLIKRLDRLDRASAGGPWTRQTLELIAAHEERRAGDLAELVGREMKPFKLDVRKLKNLGLTESLKVGYRISPRGRRLMEARMGHGS